METGLKENMVNNIDRARLVNTYGFYGFVESDEEKPYNGNYQIWRSCSMGTKTNLGIHAYLPVDWVSIYGYTANDLEKWVNLINEAFGAELTFDKEVTQFPYAPFRPAVVDTKEGHNVQYPYSANELNGVTSKVNQWYAKIENDEWYTVKIPEHKGNLGVNYNYCLYVLLRHITNYHYKEIIRDAFEIYPQLSYSNNKALTAILIASGIHKYDPYFGLLKYSSLRGLDLIDPKFERVDELNESFKESSWDRFPTQAQTVPIIKERNWALLEKVFFMAKNNLKQL